MPTPRPFIVAGNWKMNLDRQEAATLTQAVADGYEPLPGETCVVIPPYPYLIPLVERLIGTRIHVGAQDCSPEEAGAFTGDVAAPMLRDCGCEYVVLGHSERRAYHGEESPILIKKLQRARDAELTPIFCVGEPLAVRSRGSHISFVTDQVVSALRDFVEGVAPEDLWTDFIVAYEPVWAIGTGEVATPAQAQEMCAEVRKALTELGGDAWTDIPILYGGSVKPGNAAELASQPDVDGFLVGGASLKAEDFLGIIRQARTARA